MNHEHNQGSQTEVQNSEPHRPPSNFETVTKISDLQRMNIEQLQTYARNIGLKHTSSLPKSGVVFEIVKTMSENPNEVLYGEGVLEVLLMDLDSSVPLITTIFLQQKTFMYRLLRFADSNFAKGILFMVLFVLRRKKKNTLRC